MTEMTYEQIEQELVQKQIDAIDAAIAHSDTFIAGITPLMLPSNKLNSEAASQLTRVLGQAQQNREELTNLSNRLKGVDPVPFP